MTRRRRRILIGLVIGASACVVAGYCYIRLQVSRYVGYAIYGNALCAYGQTYGTQPASLADLEACYNTYEFRKTELPMAGVDPARRPQLRAPWPTDDGEYLIMVEAEPAEWYSRLDRLVTFARGDDRELSHARIERVWAWELADLIAQDGARRLAAAADGYVP